MQKIILIAVAVVVLSQGISFLNKSYPEGGFVGASKRTEVFQMMATRGEEVSAALRAVTPGCFETAAGGAVSPLAAEMFGEVLAGLTTMPSAKQGKEPTEAEIGAYQAENMGPLVAIFESKLAALSGPERAAFDESQSVLDRNAQKIVACALEAAHGTLKAGQANG